jgi:hypothetical protein
MQQRAAPNAPRNRSESTDSLFASLNASSALLLATQATFCVMIIIDEHVCVSVDCVGVSFLCMRVCVFSDVVWV